MSGSVERASKVQEIASMLDKRDARVTEVKDRDEDGMIEECSIGSASEILEETEEPSEVQIKFEPDLNNEFNPDQYDSKSGRRRERGQVILPEDAFSHIYAEVVIKDGVLGFGGNMNFALQSRKSPDELRELEETPEMEEGELSLDFGYTGNVVRFSYGSSLNSKAMDEVDSLLDYLKDLNQALAEQYDN